MESTNNRICLTCKCQQVFDIKSHKSAYTDTGREREEQLILPRTTRANSVDDTPVSIHRPRPESPPEQTNELILADDQSLPENVIALNCH